MNKGLLTKAALGIVLLFSMFLLVGEAVDGVDGVNKFRELSPEITTLDITMPNMDGLEALKEIKKINANAKIIMVTAAGQQSKMVEAIKSGASEFVTKPFEADEITGLIAKM